MPEPWEEQYETPSERMPWEEGYAASVGGPSIGPRGPRSLIDQVKDYVAGLASERRIGAGEREEAKAAGIGLTMTPAELLMAASAPLLPIAGAAAPLATLAGMLGGHFGAKVGGGIGEAGAESFAPGAGSLGREVGEVTGGLAGGYVGPKVPGYAAATARAARDAARAGASGVVEAIAKIPPGTLETVSDVGGVLSPRLAHAARLVPKVGRIAGRIAGTGTKAAPVAVPAPSVGAPAASYPASAFANVPDLSRFIVPGSTARVAPVVAEAAAPVVAVPAPAPPVAVPAPAAASVAPALVASEAPAATAALSPKVVFDLAFKQAVAAGKSVPEAATIARAARMQAATGTGGQLAQSLGPVAPAAPTGLNAAHTPELAAIAEKAAEGFTPSRPPPPATPGWTPPLRDPAFLEQSALLAKLLEENAPSVVKVLKRRRAS